MRTRQPLLLVVLLIVAVLGGCGGLVVTSDSPGPMHPVSTPDHRHRTRGVRGERTAEDASMVDPDNVYAAGAEMLSPAVRADRPLVYVPHIHSTCGPFMPPIPLIRQAVSHPLRRARLTGQCCRSVKAPVRRVKQTPGCAGADSVKQLPHLLYLWEVILGFSVWEVC
jgi:hypothetical protein